MPWRRFRNGTTGDNEAMLTILLIIVVILLLVGGGGWFRGRGRRM